MSSSRYRVVIADCNFPSDRLEREELRNVASVERFQCETESEVIAAAENADGLIVQYAPVTETVLNALPQLRVISRYGIGLDMIDVEAAKRRNIPVFNVPDYCLEEVSDHTVALIFSVLRKIRFFTEKVRSGVWSSETKGTVRRFKDATIGLLAFGNIARRTAEKLTCFGCKILAYDPAAEDADIRKYGVEPVSFDVCVSNADVLSIHVPLNRHTRHMINRDVFAKMKPGAFIVNTSRGGLIDEDAMYEALKEGTLEGAALDVLETEPPDRNSPLFQLDNVIITPHVGFLSESSMDELQRRTARAVGDYLKEQG